MGEIWRNFINGEVHQENIEPVILRSWQRSAGYQIAPEKAANNELLPDLRLRERCQQHEDLIRAGQPVLPDIFNLLQGSNYIALLCDSEGFILESLGDPPFMSKAQQVYLSPGASWREEVKGTNAIGTALTENAPVKVLGWEHFVKENHFLACWAAPIRNLQGQTVGVLDITGDIGNPNHRTLEIVIMAARMIEQNLQLLELNRNFQLVRQGITVAGELLREGFLAIDSQGLITEINQIGAALLGRKREDVIGRSANEVFRSSKGWVINNNGLDVKLSEETGEVLSRLRQLTDVTGKTMGAVGVLQSVVKETAVNPLWVGSHELT
ncbi:MAG TPA: GAF domain-containing protein, partial [Verrucomicrobiae bacterium]|nr:GAF domain-containing protein [Verrucomicrobiae bacterium]